MSDHHISKRHNGGKKTTNIGPVDVKRCWTSSTRPKVKVWVLYFLFIFHLLLFSFNIWNKVLIFCRIAVIVTTFPLLVFTTCRNVKKKDSCRSMQGRDVGEFFYERICNFTLWYQYTSWYSPLSVSLIAKRYKRPCMISTVPLLPLRLLRCVTGSGLVQLMSLSVSGWEPDSSLGWPNTSFAKLWRYFKALDKC